MSRPTLTGIYHRHLGETERAMTAHLPRLRELAKGCDLAVELGCKHGASASTLLMEAKRVISYDIVESPHARELERVAAHWEYRLEDTFEAEIPECDLMLVDSLHTYAQVQGEMERHADKVRRTLVFHDILTFGVVGADGESGRQLWSYSPGQSVPQECLGIRPAIDELMIRDPSWRIVASYTDSHGLLVLERAR